MRQDEKRLRSEQESFTTIMNKDLQCKDCMFRWDDSENYLLTKCCDVYNVDGEEQVKPDGIYVGKPCEYYEPEEE